MADIVLVGEDPRGGGPSYIVVELKQWSEATTYTDDVNLVSVPAYGRPVTHPVLRVRGYCDYLVDFRGDFFKTLVAEAEPQARRAL